jgi:hypothetical protein
MKERNLVTAEELLTLFPITPRQLRELRFRRKIPYITLGHRTIVYEPAAVLAALRKLEIKEVA